MKTITRCQDYDVTLSKLWQMKYTSPAPSPSSLFRKKEKKKKKTTVQLANKGPLRKLHVKKIMTWSCSQFTYALTGTKSLCRTYTVFFKNICGFHGASWEVGMTSFRSIPSLNLPFLFLCLLFKSNLFALNMGWKKSWDYF